MTNFPHNLKDKLSENEYSALCRAVDKKAENTVSYYGLCLAVRCDSSFCSAYDTVKKLRKNIRDAHSLTEYIAAVKTLYLANRNMRQTAECSYGVEGDNELLKTALMTAVGNTHVLLGMLSSKSILTLCKARKCFDDLKFFASVLKSDKTVYTTLGERVEAIIGKLDAPLSKKLIPAFLSIPSLEQAEELYTDFDKIFSAIKRTRKNTDEIVFWSAKGLDVYGFCEQADALRAWATERFLASDKRFDAATVTEIIVNN